MSGKRVLIVDDALELGRMLRAALESLNAGLNVRVVPSAEEAMLETARQAPALIVTDIRLPGISGFDLIAKVRARSQETRFILMTGMSDLEVLERAEKIGADRFMRKPIHVSDFLDAASFLLELDQAPKPQPAVEEPTPPPAADLSGLLSGLRRELGAAVVLLADDRGRVTAQAGELADLNFEQDWAPLLLPALSALNKASRLVQTGLTEGALAFRGPALSVIAAPVGDFALAVLVPADTSGLRTALVFEQIQYTQKELLRILESMGVRFRPPSQPEPVSETAAEPEPQELEEVQTTGLEPAALEFEKVLGQTLQPVDASSLDEFWENAMEQTAPLPTNPDALTYEQALKLGLTPQDDSE